jgi:hypothetical protein
MGPPSPAAPAPVDSAALATHDPAAGGMVFTAAAELPGKPRTLRGVQWQRPTVAAGVPADPWSRFVHTTGASWLSSWDRATQAPLRVWGEGMAAPGTMASPAAAEAFARRVLTEHLALWAPGASASDFRLVANHSDGDIRSIGFVQTYQGMDVIGGQLSFRFKRDRLVVIASEAIPNLSVAAPARRARLAATTLRQRVGQKLSALGLPAAAQVVTVDDARPQILPILGDDAVLGARVVVPHRVEGGTNGRWMIYADPTTGETLAFESLSFYATGQLLYRVVSRYPGVPRIDVPAANVNVKVGANSVSTDGNGMLTWTPDTPQTLTTSVTAARVNAVNKADTSVASATLTIAPSGQAVWDASANVIQDSQVNVIAHVNRAKAYVRTFAPTLAALDAPITANVNINMECNASFDGSDLNFFRASSRCENTGLIADVVYHEFGHAMHFYSIIPGVGRMDGAFSEGLSDYLAASITGDPGMGRGFFFNDSALRHLDPESTEPRWPRDTGEIHKTGVIFGAAMWDLRKALITSLGSEAAAVPVVNRLFYAAVQRASDIPSTVVEVLLADDNDGNLANGTPNECIILQNFGKHGLVVTSGFNEAPGAVVAAGRTTEALRFTLIGRSPRCPSENVTGVEVRWLPGKSGRPQGGKVAATQDGDPDHWVAQVPLPSSDVLTYSTTFTFASDVTVTLPDNYADSSYQLYEGATVPLLCANMDTSPLTAGWTASPGWSFGAAAGNGKNDPAAAFTGRNVLAIALGDLYAKDSRYTLTLPTIDTGNYSDVRLQYRRWLTVEDSEFDKATITANGKQAWINATEGAGDASGLAHVDREWRFHDVSLSPFYRGGQLSLAFGLSTDGGLEFGGWTIDDLCVVADPASICGDGQVTGPEQCDDGAANSDAPNKCRVDCKSATCGDGIVDSGEECDAGDSNGADGQPCSATCVSSESAGGCCDAGGGNPAASLLMALGVLLLVSRRRLARA